MSDRMDPPEVLELFQSQLELVELIARQVGRSLGTFVEHTELVAAGREGLLDAARRYDSSHGVSFRSYANYRIYGAIYDDVRRISPVPRRARERLLALDASSLVNEARQEDLALGPEELASSPENGLFDQLTRFVTAAATGMVVEPSTEQPPIEPSADDDPERTAEKAELLALIREGLESLSPNESDLIGRYYFGEERLEDIARDLGVSRSWVSRLHSRAIARLAKRVRNRT